MKEYFRKILSKKALKLLGAVAIGVATIATIVLLPSGKIQICWVDNGREICQKFTQNEYQNIKIVLIEKVEKKEPLTLQEYQFLIRIYDFEIKNRGKLQFSDIKSADEILGVLNKTMKLK